MFFDGNNGCNSTEFNVYTQMINVIPTPHQNGMFRTVERFSHNRHRSLSFKGLYAVLTTSIRAYSSGAGITIIFNQGLAFKPFNSQ
jgi:hypothetical protein